MSPESKEPVNVNEDRVMITVHQDYLEFILTYAWLASMALAGAHDQSYEDVDEWLNEMTQMALS